MNHAYLDRLTVPSNSIVWGLSANHGEKRELGGEDHDITGPITENRPADFAFGGARTTFLAACRAPRSGAWLFRLLVQRFD
jgi:nitrogen fixation protein FixH